ncbi:unnamed protein product [Prorocentrum cordatum]|uniref:RNA helicase n=1 Tax=Prorocentrum cordatum TaxID=2364126 RepID=A0ABN9XDS7_9DINO|nr:unnamed protein product [Polarella glacialis]
MQVFCPDSEQTLDPWTAFSDCSFQPSLARALAALGFEAPSPIQAYCWPLILSGRDVVGVAETGSGKTLAFLVPVTPPAAGNKTANPAMLVLAPTRELASQIESEAQKIGQVLAIRSCCLYGGVDFKRQIKDLSQTPALVVACPGRLKDMAVRKHICRLSDTCFLALDEADRMLDMGFEEDVRDIVGLLPESRQTVLFTATLPKNVLNIIGCFTKNAIRVHQRGHEGAKCNPRVSQDVRVCWSQAEKIAALLGFLGTLPAGSRVLVFVNTKAAISEVCKDLRHAGLAPVSLHGDLEQSERERALKEFRSGDSCLAVATDVASRGLDVRDVQGVVCFDASKDTDTHVHRVGRTGGAGASGKALTLVQSSKRADLRMAQCIFGLMGENGQTVDPKIVREVEACLDKKMDVVEDGTGLLIAADSSDEDDDSDGSDRDVSLEAAIWSPWYKRSCDFSADATLTPSFMAGAAGASGLMRSLSVPVCSGASDIGSVLSGTTYLQNEVEHMFGHAAARDISAKMCNDTVRSGCRLLTHDQSSTNAFKPYRWMVFRRVPLTDIASMFNQFAPIHGSVGRDFVWHVVVHELARTRAGKVRVVTNYFKSNISLVYDYIRDAFQLLDEDDPAIIEAAMSTESVVTVLRLYFETGDTQNPRFYHNMTKVNLWPAGTLLHHCCESGFSRCVAYLLNQHSPQTAPREKPWFQLADPFYLEPSWKNSAFHSAAWAGQSEVMNELVRWCRSQQCVSKIRHLCDKKGNSPLDLVELRIKNMQWRSGQDASRYNATFNSLAPIFGRTSLKHVSGQALELERSILTTDHLDQRHRLELPSGDLSFKDLVRVVTIYGNLLSGEVDTLLLSRVDIKPLSSGEDEQSVCREFVSLARSCRRVAFVNCYVHPATSIHICRAVSHQLLKLRDGVKVTWESFAFPSWLVCSSTLWGVRPKGFNEISLGHQRAENRTSEHVVSSKFQVQFNLV